MRSSTFVVRSAFQSFASADIPEDVHALELEEDHATNKTAQTTRDAPTQDSFGNRSLLSRPMIDTPIPRG
jgi:hypothetical protein